MLVHIFKGCLSVRSVVTLSTDLPLHRSDAPDLRDWPAVVVVVVLVLVLVLVLGVGVGGGGGICVGYGGDGSMLV